MSDPCEDGTVGFAVADIYGVIWGLGETTADAFADAAEWLAEGEDPGYSYGGALLIVPVDADRWIRIMGGEVNCGTLGIEIGVAP